MGESLKYKELLLQSQEEKDQKDVQFQVEQAELQLQSDILATKQSLAEAKGNLEVSKASSPFQAARVVDFQIAVEALEDGLKRLEALKVELF